MRSFALTSYLQYFLSGLVITTIGSVMPQLLAHYGLSYTEGGRLVFLGSVGFLIGVPLSSYLMVRMNEKTVLSIAALLIAVAQLGMFMLPSFGLVTLFNFINSIGVAALETIVATLMMEVFVGRRAVVMSYLEVSFGLGALLMPLIASILIANSAWKYSFLFTAALAAAMTVIWRFVAFAKDKADVGEPLDASAPPPQRMTARRKWQLLALFGFMIILYSGIEGSLNNFLSSVFIGYLEQVPYYASLSIGIFWTAMVIGRAATGWIIRKMSYGRFLMEHGGHACRLYWLYRPAKCRSRLCPRHAAWLYDGRRLLDHDGIRQPYVSRLGALRDELYYRTRRLRRRRPAGAYRLCDGSRGNRCRVMARGRLRRLVHSGFADDFRFIPKGKRRPASLDYFFSLVALFARAAVRFCSTSIKLLNHQPKEPSGNLSAWLFGIKACFFRLSSQTAAFFAFHACRSPFNNGQPIACAAVNVSNRGLSSLHHRNVRYLRHACLTIAVLTTRLVLSLNGAFPAAIRMFATTGTHA